MKIQILISKTSWANNYKKFLKDQLKEFTKNINFSDSHKKLKKNYHINIILSYFKIIPQKYLNYSKHNLLLHESNLPKGKGWSPITYQILENKKKIFFSLIEANNKFDSGKIYFKKKVNIPKHFLFKEIKNLQIKENLNLIKKFIRYYKKNKKAPTAKLQTGRKSYYKKRTKKDSQIKLNVSIKKQFNLLRSVDDINYPAFFKYLGKKFIIKISKS